MIWLLIDFADQERKMKSLTEDPQANHHKGQVRVEPADGYCQDFKSGSAESF